MLEKQYLLALLLDLLDTENKNTLQLSNQKKKNRN